MTLKREDAKVRKSIKCKLGWHLSNIVYDLNLGEKYSYCDKCQKELWRKKLGVDATYKEVIEKIREAEEKIKRKAYCNQCQTYELFEFVKERGVPGVFRCTVCGKDYSRKWMQETS